MQVGPDSATARSLNPEIAHWATRTKTNELLADIFDMLAMINANIVAIGQRKRAKTPKPYPRPGDQPSGQKHFGKDAMPADELQAWFERKRRERNG